MREFLRELNFGQGVSLNRSTVNDQYLALARTVRHYLMADWLETARRRRESRPKMVGYLSAEYLLGRQLGNALLATRPGQGCRGGSGRLWDRPGDVAGAGGRAGARQRRPGSAGGVLRRLAGDHGRVVHRVRDPLRVRHLRPDLRRRATGRGARLVAGAGRAVGVPAPRARGPGRLRRPHRAVPRRVRTAPDPMGARVERAGRAVSLHGPWLPERCGQHAAAVERPGDEGVRPGHLQRRRLRRGRARADVRREHHQGPLPGGLHAARA